jgi:hypothetical protein
MLESIKTLSYFNLNDIRLTTRVVVLVACENFNKFEKPSPREAFVNLIVKAHKVGPRHDPRMAFEERTAL